MLRFREAWARTGRQSWVGQRRHARLSAGRREVPPHESRRPRRPVENRPRSPAPAPPATRGRRRTLAALHRDRRRPAAARRGRGLVPERKARPDGDRDRRRQAGLERGGRSGRDAARCVRLCGGPARGDGLGQGRRQGRAGDDRGGPARGGRPGDRRDRQFQRPGRARPGRRPGRGGAGERAGGAGGAGRGGAEVPPQPDAARQRLAEPAGPRGRAGPVRTRPARTWRFHSGRRRRPPPPSKSIAAARTTRWCARRSLAW